VLSDLYTDVYSICKYSIRSTSKGRCIRRQWLVIEDKIKSEKKSSRTNTAEAMDVVIQGEPMAYRRSISQLELHPSPSG
jgi:hypothetical protein